MQAIMEFVPAILATGVAYVLMLAGMWKHDIKKVYSRRVRKEKLLTVALLAMAVVIMLLLVSHQVTEQMSNGYLSKQMYDGLSILFCDNMAIVGMIVYLLGSLPVLVLSACALDELSEKYTQLSLPFYFYIVLFQVESLFWRPMETTIAAWLGMILIAGIFYGLAKWHGKGITKLSKVIIFLSLMAVVGIMIVEKNATCFGLIRYIALFALSIGVVWVLNRASVLKKKIWYVAVIVCYLLLFMFI